MRYRVHPRALQVNHLERAACRVVTLKNFLARPLSRNHAMRYILDMTNHAFSQPANQAAQIIAANLDAELTRKRWTKRKAAEALGLTHMYVSRRANGEVELSGSDLAMFAGFLEVPVSRFFVGLPEVDSNHQPAGSQSAASNRPLAPVTTLKPRTHSTISSGTAGVVTPLHATI